MINKLVGAATLFTASAVFIAGAPRLQASPVTTFGSDAALTAAGTCGSQEPKQDAPKGDAKAPAKAKDGSCGKGSCSKDMKDKKHKKDGSCSKDKKEASCSKDKKEASCSKDKK